MPFLGRRVVARAVVDAGDWELARTGVAGDEYRPSEDAVGLDGVGCLHRWGRPRRVVQQSGVHERMDDALAKPEAANL